MEDNKGTLLTNKEEERSSRGSLFGRFPISPSLGFRESGAFAVNAQEYKLHPIERKIYENQVIEHHREFKDKWCDDKSYENKSICPCEGKMSKHFRKSGLWMRSPLKDCLSFGGKDENNARYFPSPQIDEDIIIPGAWYWLELLLSEYEDPRILESYGVDVRQNFSSTTTTTKKRRRRGGFRRRIFAKIKFSGREGDDTCFTLTKTFGNVLICYSRWIVKAHLCTHLDVDQDKVFQ